MRLPRLPRSKRDGRAALWLLGVVVLGVGLGGAAAYQQLMAGTGSETPIWRPVERGRFELAVTERGEVQAVDALEIRSEVQTSSATGLSILQIVPEGTEVAEGDLLCELDSSALQEERTLQQIAVNSAEAVVVESKNLYETAQIAKQEYLEGLFVQEEQSMQGEVFVAEENLSRAKEYLKYSQRLAEKGYVNDLQLQADAFAVEKTRKELEAAKTRLAVLRKHTKAKTLKQLESDIVIARAKFQSDQSSLQLERDRLADIEQQIAACRITAPRSGSVVYAHVRDRRGQNDFVVEEGAVIRERQVIMRLPQMSQMRVELKINESLVQRVSEGMPATIRPVGLDGVAIPGHVEVVNQYAEPTGWRRANVKEYKAYVRLDEALPAVRSGMTASVTVHALRLPDVVQAPVQAVYNHGGQPYCFVKRDNAIEPIAITCGPTNDQFFVIEEGLTASDTVAMNPRRLLEEVELPELADAGPAPRDAEPGERRGPPPGGASGVTRAPKPGKPTGAT